MVLVKDVGHRLPALRKERGLTQADLAELIGHSEVAVRSIERGASAPSFETLGRLTRALEVPAVRSSPSAELRSDEHTSELQSLMRISYAVLCLKNTKR